MFNFRFGALGALVIAAASAFGSAANATTTVYSYSVDGSTTGLGSAGPFGQVTVSDTGGILDFTVALASPYQFHDSNSAKQNSFLFDLVGDPRVNISITQSNFSRIGANPAPGVTGTSVIDGPSFNDPNSGAAQTFWSYGIDVNENSCGSPAGSSNGCGSSLHFTVTHVDAGNNALTDLTLASLNALPYAGTTGIYFVSSIIGKPAGCTSTTGTGCSTFGLTGNVGATFLRDEAPPPEVPLPGAAFLMGSVLAGGAGFGAWRRRRRERFAA